MESYLENTGRIKDREENGNCYDFAIYFQVLSKICILLFFTNLDYLTYTVL